MNNDFYNKKILILDDDEDDYTLSCDYINAVFGNSFIIDWCNNYDRGVSYLLDHQYDLYLVDYRLGARTGIDFLQTARANNVDEPIVLLTGKGNYDIDILAMEMGAVDYLVKTELNTEKIGRCIRYAIGRSMTLKALKQNELKYRRIFEQSKDIIFVTDFNYKFLDVNPAIEQILGFSIGEVFKMNLIDLFDDPSAQHFKDIFKSGVVDVNDREVVLLTKKKQKKYCTITITPDESNISQTRIQGIIHDITNLKIIEKSKLQTEKLASASRILRTIAHEVRNPINNISLAAEQIKNEPGKFDNPLYLDIIQRNSKRINDLITEMLHTSTPTVNAKKLYPLQEIISEVIANSIDRLTLLHMSFFVSSPEEPIYIHGDKSNLKLALLNVVMNAIEAMVEEKGKLMIYIYNSETGPVLEISENGCGIDEDDLTRLFEPLYTKKKNGTGLGLTYALGIFQMHEANVDVSSVKGFGTTFKILFPKPVIQDNFTN